MKIRTNVKVFFLIISVLSCVLMSKLFFTLIFDSYIEGANTITKIHLLDIAAQNESVDQKINGIYIYSDWDKFPQEIRDKISHRPSISNKLYRVFGSYDENSSEKWDRVFYVLLTENKNGQPVYVGKFFNWKKASVTIGEFNFRIYSRALLISICMAIIFSVILFFILKLVIQPLEDLKVWANKISKNEIESANPEQVRFRYKEFSDIANVIYKSIQREKVGIEREKEFLAYSSHELRSPLALLKANCELLKIVIDKNNLKQLAAVERIEIATETMTRLIETLLRLGNDDTQELEIESFDLEKVVNQKMEQAKYLLKGKEITLTHQTNSYDIDAPFVPCEIVITNLIGNAFQHAHQGEIKIEQKEASLTIINVSETDVKHSSKGFGLGLILIEKICKKYQWMLQVEECNGCYIAKVSFSQQ